MRKRKITHIYKPCVRILALLSIAFLAAGCAEDSPTINDVGSESKIVLKSSESNEEFTKDFKTYLVEMIEDQKVVENSNQDDVKAIAITTDAAVSEMALASASAEAAVDVGISVSGTNLIEKGVDESDLVKSDGRQLYIARQAKISYNYDINIDLIKPVTLDVLNTSASSLSVSPEFYVPIIESPASVRIMSLDNKEPNSKEIALIELPDDVSTVLGLYFTKKRDDGTATQMVVVANVFSDKSTFFYQDNNIRVFSFDISNPEKPEKQWKMEIEGYLHASRSMNGKLYLISTKYFRLKNLPDYSIEPDAVAENKKLVNDLSIDDIFPSTWVNDEKITLVKADNCMVLNEQSTSRVYQPSLLTVFTIPIDQPKETKTLCTLESSAEVYVSPNSIYFTKGEYVYSDDLAEMGRSYTIIHKLAFTPDSVAYKSSVRIPGWTGWRNKSFRMSEFNNDLRIVVSDYEFIERVIPPIPVPLPIEPTSEDVLERAPVSVTETIETVTKENVSLLASDSGNVGNSNVSSEPRDANVSGATDDNDPIVSDPSPIIIIERHLVHKLYVLREVSDNNSQLKILSQLPNKQQPAKIGKPGEEIYAVRFFGNYAYIVTFRRTDPLYAINLKDPASPFIEGELSIPGFSEYLHPISENLLLGVGKEANRNGIVKGLKVALFDVVDKSNPNILKQFILGERGSNTALSYDYKAFTILSDNETGLHRVSIPVSIHDEERQYDFSNFIYYDWSYSGLQLFEIDDGSISSEASMADAGVLKSHIRSKEKRYNYVYQPRSLIVNDAVHYVENAKVWSALWSSPEIVNGPK